MVWRVSLGKLLFVATFTACTASYSDGGAISKWSCGFVWQVKARHVGACFTQGALVRKLYQPGWHAKMPLVTGCYNVPIQPVIEEYRNVECGAKGTHVPLVIPVIRVKYQVPEHKVLDILERDGRSFEDRHIEDHLYNDVNRKCSSMTVDEVHTEKFAELEDIIMHDLVVKNTNTSILILDVNVPRKVTLPEEYARGYATRAQTRTAIDIRQKQILEAKAEAEKNVIKAESTNRIDILSAEKNASLVAIQANATRVKDLADARNKARIRNVDAEAELYRAKKIADAKRFATIAQAQADKESAILQADAELIIRKKKAEGNKDYLTPELLELERIGAWATQKPAMFLPSEAALQFWEPTFGKTIAPKSPIMSSAAAA